MSAGFERGRLAETCSMLTLRKNDVGGRHPAAAYYVTVVVGGVFR